MSDKNDSKLRKVRIAGESIRRASIRSLLLDFAVYLKRLEKCEAFDPHLALQLCGISRRIFFMMVDAESVALSDAQLVHGLLEKCISRMEFLGEGDSSEAYYMNIRDRVNQLSCDIEEYLRSSDESGLSDAEWDQEFMALATESPGI